MGTAPVRCGGKTSNLTAMGPISRPPQWVGRVPELVALRAAVGALRQGGGSVVWVEGEPGIGKSSLVAEAVAAGSVPGWDIGWGPRASSPSGCRCA